MEIVAFGAAAVVLAALGWFGWQKLPIRWRRPVRHPPGHDPGTSER